MFKMFNPRDWYWIINNDETSLWSSKESKYVGPTDSGYVAWSSIHHATRISTLDNLKGILESYNLAVPE